jgi:hypothetical protein
VVNNVVVSRTTVVNITNITVYRNVNVTHAVVGVPADHFGRGHVKVTRISQTELQQLRPVHGKLDVRPVAASVMPATGPAVRPPAALQARPVVATRAPKDLTPTLREHGLPESREMSPAPRLVPSPKREAPSRGAGVAPPSGAGKMPAAPPGPAGPTPRGPERGTGGIKTAPPPTGAAKAPAPEMPGPDGKRVGGPERTVKPSPAEKPGLPSQKLGPGERPLPHGGPQAQAPASRPGPPPKAEHPKHVEQPNKPAQGESPDKSKER